MQQYGPEGEAEGGRGKARVGVGDWGGGGEAGRGLVKMWKGWLWAQRGSRWSGVSEKQKKTNKHSALPVCDLWKC